MTADLDALMDFVVRTAEAAGRVTLEHFGSVQVQWKPDGTEVTLADTAAEESIRTAISDRFPDHGILGEEGGRVDHPSPYRWVIDPIDGTRSFASGVPLYGVLIALQRQNVPVLGCCHFPALGDTVVAALGAGCWRAGKRVRVSTCDDLAEARLVTSGLEYWRDWATPEGQAGFARLVERTRFCRTWGDCFGYMLVATGRAEIFADPASGAEWDYSPIVPILTEAGGRFTSLGGDPVSAWRTALASNGILHDRAVDCWGAGAADDALQLGHIISRRAER
jgi:histidinol phosphatase-like enzyme (inositol monophosphatase family)